MINPSVDESHKTPKILAGQNHVTEPGTTRELIPLDDKPAMPVANIDTDKPRGLIENGLLMVALFIVVCISLTLWLSLLPVWWYQCARTVIFTAGLNVVSVFIRGEPANLASLERVIGLWPRGFAAIVNVLHGESGRHEVERRDIKDLLVETGLAIVFFSILFFTNEIARWSASTGFSLGTFTWHIVFSVVRWLLGESTVPASLAKSAFT